MPVRQGPLPTPQTAQLLAEIRQVARAMDHLHAKRILHRDLKSANVLYGDDGACSTWCELSSYIPEDSGRPPLA